MTGGIGKRLSLLRETAEMALDTLWANKMRSALTVLGVVIGITSIVSMTALGDCRRGTYFFLNNADN